MNRLSKIGNMIAPALLCCLLTVSCSTEEEHIALPDGKYPMTFKASVGDLVVSRAVGKDAWGQGDRIGISVDGGTHSKIYQVTDPSAGALEPILPGDAYYWKQSKGQQISAWYPADDAVNEDISNQTADFASFDYLFSDNTYDFTNSPVNLVFGHRMAKVKCILQKGDGITDDDLVGATVHIYGYTKANFAKGVLTGTTDGWISPTADKEALVVPRQMQNRKFIQITIGSVHYYYTPEVSNDANLLAGYLYTYTLTVKKTGLDVAVGTPVSWGNGAAIDGGSVSVISNYKITIPTVTGVSNLVVTDGNGKVMTANPAGTYALPAIGNTFSISYTNTVNSCKSFIPTVSGLCDITRDYTYSTQTYVCKYSNVASDLALAFDDYVQVGDNYYPDGTWGPRGLGRSDDIGSVFYVGTGPGDDIGNYTGLPSGYSLTKIHGYVAALSRIYDATSSASKPYDRFNYGGTGTYNNLKAFDVPEIPNGDRYSFNGYTVTKLIWTNYSNSSSYHFPFFQCCYGPYFYHGIMMMEDYKTYAPTTTSGWYIPSVAMLKAMVQSGRGVASWLTCSEVDADKVFSYDGDKIVELDKNAKVNNTEGTGYLACAVLTF